MAPACAVDLSAHFTPESLPQRLRRLADVAEERGIGGLDTYGQAEALQRFEAEVARFLGKEGAVFFATGTLAQRAALHVHVKQLAASKGRVILHPTSHLAQADPLLDGETQAKRARTEASERLSEFNVTFAGEFTRTLSLTDISGPGGSGISMGDVLVVELPQRMNGGRTMPWEELVKLSSVARVIGARMHMDGARLWDVQPFYGKPLHEICALFDSVYVSFYKGLGAMNGAILCSDRAFVFEARNWRKRLGGNLWTFAPHWLDAQVQFEKVVRCPDEMPSFETRFAKLREVVQALSEHSLIRHIVRFEPPVPEAALVHGYLHGSVDGLEEAHARVQKETGIRLWNKLRGQGYRRGNADTIGSSEEQYFEWNMGPANALLPMKDFLKGWDALAKELMVPD
eukprot:TRINITY_DN21900_c0_g1_i1.p1 TRINITY_DN21900_c0_g1~~TRINITY_DN21900_c0_g1_i1.p1  ORF type:complete len:400 (+),score=51.46 TRINITY_DN21900_c0_g1_i1:65-1264(+)